MLKPNSFLKLKSNRVIHQNDNTSNCGYMAAKFLIDRFRGQSFPEASGYENAFKYNRSKHYEQQIERLKKTPMFGYI